MNNLLIPLLSQTRESYIQKIHEKLGKGTRHAALIYQEWFRTGKITGSDPAFNNAQELLSAILNLTDLSMLPLATQRSDEITQKFLLKTKENLEIESVLIPMQAGGTLCVSSQVGCRMGCAFCETGRMGLLRNLEPYDIISQVYTARFILGYEVRNIVFMGMGEPFDNYDAVMQSIRILSDPHGLSIGHNHLTVSTSGCIEGIYKLMSEIGPIPHLAVSVNAPNDEIRNKLMPVNRKHNMKELYEAMKAFCNKTGKPILAAYVLIKDLNDSIEHAKELADYLQGLDVKVNLIPYNPQSRDRFEPPTEEKITAFMDYLRGRDYYTLLRQTKGRDIMAACGQLGNVKLRRALQSMKKISS